MSTERRFVDLSHTIEHGMITYPGLPAPIITGYLSREESRSHYSEGTEFLISKIEMVANTGTYLDSPFHRYSGGSDLSKIELSSIADLQGIVVHTTERRISAAAFESVNVTGKAVLVHTGWDVHWRTEQYLKGHPHLSEDAARYLADCGAALVGIDSLNIDSTEDGRRPAHSILLAANIPIVEHLCGLHQLPKTGFRFFAVPPMVKGFGSFPIRAFAILG